MRISRRNLLISSSFAPLFAKAQNDSGTLPVSVSLPEELLLALTKAQPLLVMVSLEGCPFCKVVRHNYLIPLMRQGWTVVQVDMRSNRMLKSLTGTSLSHDELIRSWGVRIAPTVLFLGSGGIEIAERLNGAYIPEYYGAYLDARLAQARATFKPEPAGSKKS